MNFSVDYAGFVANLLRLRPGDKCVGSLDILDVENEEHVIRIVSHLPESRQRQSIFGGRCTVRVEIDIPL